MSDSEAASEFRFDDSDSDGYVQPAKGKKAPAKKAAAAPKKVGIKVRIVARFLAPPHFVTADTDHHHRRHRRRQRQ